MSQQINLKSFRLVVQNTVAYRLVIDGFSKTSLWFLTLTQSLLLTADAKLQLKSTVPISISSVLEFGIIHLTSKITASITNTVTFESLAKLTYKITSSISNTVVFEYLMQLTMKASAILNTTHEFVFVMITAVFNTLGDYDTETLGTMDVITLGTLDYTAT